MKDFLFRGSLHEIDPSVEELIQIENERQFRRLILIPSESSSPAAVLQALGSRFQNLYAEGYPDEASRELAEAEILDYPTRLADFRRYSVPRYYKGVEYADCRGPGPPPSRRSLCHPCHPRGPDPGECSGAFGRAGQ